MSEGLAPWILSNKEFPFSNEFDTCKRVSHALAWKACVIQLLTNNFLEDSKAQWILLKTWCHIKQGVIQSDESCNCPKHIILWCTSTCRIWCYKLPSLTCWGVCSVPNNTRETDSVAKGSNKAWRFRRWCCGP